MMNTADSQEIRILIAEDSPTQSEQLRYLLEAQGYRVTTAANGRKALAAAQMEKPTLILSDVLMPELDGFGFCSAVKADPELREVPVILLTSLTSPSDVVKGMECGANYFLRKPYDEGHLLSRIDHVLHNRGARETSFNGSCEVVLAGEHHTIHSERPQILDLLISIYEEAVRINEELVGTNRQLEARNREVERASKFKDAFLSMMSHELRTPMNAVLGFSELLSDLRHGPLNECQQRYVNQIYLSSQRLVLQINDILDLSTIEAGRIQLTLEDLSVPLAFAEVCSAMHPLVEKKSQTLRQSASPELVVRANGARFRQILMNLLGNAIKFTPDGGTIALSAHRIDGFVRMEVRDSGPGIPAEEKQRIFEAFHRLKQSDQSTEGTGLGLTITRSLVELHGGRLDLESQPGSGSCFYFTLPAASTPGEEEDAKSK
jgi:signal transduction histidine kinase